MNGVIRWEEPPPKRGIRGNWAPRRHEHWRMVAQQLRERPGEWAVVHEGDNWNRSAGLAPQIKDGRMASFRPAGSFEAQTRTTDSGFCVYARYVGTERGDA